MTPDEASWVGDGNGWNNDSSSTSCKLLRRLKGKFRCRNKEGIEGVEEDVDMEEGENEKNSSTWGFNWSSSSSSSNEMNQPIPTTNSNSNSAAPLKQHLLAVLRMRLREGGGSSKGGEAGLRFKK